MAMLAIFDVFVKLGKYRVGAPDRTYHVACELRRGRGLKLPGNAPQRASKVVGVLQPPTAVVATE